MHSMSSSPNCSTPASLRFRPLNSSPLATSPTTSPVIAAQARRKSQYKCRLPQTPTVPSRRASGNYSEGSRHPSSKRSVSAYSVSVPENPPKLSMREKFRARCLERAVKAREKTIKGKRHVPYHLSSDDQPMDDDDSEDEEDIMMDELFRRIMENTNRRHQHSYRVSYATEVGSSFDPKFDDADAWERELAASVRPSRSSPTRIPSSLTDHEEVNPFELDEAELEEYAEEYDRISALADFEDLPEDVLFGWSDFDELAEEKAPLSNAEEMMDES